MNPFSIILLALFLIIIIKQKNIKQQYLTLSSLLIGFEMFVNIGFFVKLGSYELAYVEVILILVMVYSFVMITRFKIDKRSFIAGTLLIFSIVITTSLLAVNPLDQLIIRNREMINVEFSFYSIMISLRVIFIVIVVLSWRTLFSNKDILYISHFIHKFGRVILILCFLELISKNLFSSSAFVDITGRIFGVGDSTITFIFQRAGTYTLQGLTREPSILARGLFQFTSILVFTKKFKEIKWDLIASIIILFLSGSFSSVLFVSALLLFVFFKVNYKKKVIILIPSVVLVSVFLNTEIGLYYLMRVGRSFEFFLNPSNIDNLRTTSEAGRFTSIFYTISLFLQRPFFGIGLGIPYSYAYISSALASIGIVGFTSWYYFIFHAITRHRARTYKYILVLMFVWFFSDSMSVMYSTTTFYLALLISQNEKVQITEKILDKKAKGVLNETLQHR